MDLESKTKRGPKPGSPKTGGRQKGTPNRSTMQLRQALAEVGCSIELEIYKAIQAKNVQMLHALSLLLPYLTPKFKEAEAPSPSSKIDESLQKIDETTLKAISITK
jgi:hypothetical protein